MPTLMDLPNEILSSIIEATEPEDIESFSMCCKLMYNLAEDRLEEHKEKKTLLSTIFVEDHFLPYPQPFSSEEYGKPETYLKEFFSDKRNRFYPKTMVVNLDPDGWGPMNEYGGSRGARTNAINGLDEFEHQLKYDMVEVQNMIALDVGGIEVEDWGKQVRAGNPVATFLLLLALLPNLENLSINPFGYWPRTLSANYSTIMRLMIEATLGQQENGLSFGGRLSECLVNGNLEEIGGSLLPFIMMLPKMQEIQLFCLQIPNGSWPYKDAVSPVVDLDLEGGSDTVTLSKYIRGIRELKRFRFAHTDGSDLDWEPYRIVATLTQFAFRSLVHLDLTVNKRFEMDWSNTSPVTGSLRSFEVLETIRLHYIFLFEEFQTADSPAKVSWAEISGKTYLDRSWVIEQALIDKSLFRVQILTDFLPSSVRIFRLDGKAEFLLDTFVGFPEHRVERLPNLEMILVNAGNKINSRIKKTCKEAGVQVKSSKESSIFHDIFE